jgi:hypothetical protein
MKGWIDRRCRGCGWTPRVRRRENETFLVFQTLACTVLVVAPFHPEFADGFVIPEPIRVLGISARRPCSN